MKKRLLYGSGILALTILVTLLVWQGSFTFGDYGPGDPVQTSLYWAVSTLVFILTLTIGFMLFRTGVKLYIERRSNREGSRIRTKMVVGALGLTFLPVFFQFLLGYSLLNRNLDKWFSRPAEGIVKELGRAEQALRGEVQTKARLQGDWFASLPQMQEYLRTGVPPRELLRARLQGLRDSRGGPGARRWKDAERLRSVDRRRRGRGCRDAGARSCRQAGAQYKDTHRSGPEPAWDCQLSRRILQACAES